MAGLARKRRTLHWPITISVSLMMLNVALMVGWIVLAVHIREWNVLTIGAIAFALILVGLTFYMVLTIKEVRVSRQQSNFVDSVTHELKSPLSSLRLYLETMQLRTLDEEQRQEFYGVMEAELSRLDNLINHLLEVGRLDALGQHHATEDISVDELLRRCGQQACTQQNVEEAVAITYEIPAAVFRGRRIVLEMVFTNLIDNALKYGGSPPEVIVRVAVKSRKRVMVQIIDNGAGVAAKDRRRIFQIFFRGGDELERTRRGTGLGLYIVRTLVRIMRGSVTVSSRPDAPGSVFEVELPGGAVHEDSDR